MICASGSLSSGLKIITTWPAKSVAAEHLLLLLPFRCFEPQVHAASASTWSLHAFGLSLMAQLSLSNPRVCIATLMFGPVFLFDGIVALMAKFLPAYVLHIHSVKLVPRAACLISVHVTFLQLALHSQTNDCNGPSGPHCYSVCHIEMVARAEIF